MTVAGSSGTETGTGKEPITTVAPLWGGGRAGLGTPCTWGGGGITPEMETDGPIHNKMLLNNHQSIIMVNINLIVVVVVVVASLVAPLNE